MNDQSIEARVRKAVSDMLQIPLDDVKPESVIAELGDGDSLTRVEICMSVEDTFGIEVPDDDAEPITTVQGWIDYLANLPMFPAVKA